MKTFLIPVDFSDVSYTAAQYAIDLAGHVRARNVIFYHSYAHRPPDRFDEHTGYQSPSLRHLKKMAAKLRVPANLSTDGFVFITDDKPVEAGVEAIVDQYAVSLIVMGIAGLSDIENTLIGHNTMAVAESGVAPLLIVPRDHSFKPISNLVYATDLRDVRHVTPVESIIRLTSQLTASLHIVHVDPATRGQTPDKIQGKDELLGMLGAVDPLFKVVSEARDKADGIFEYVKTNQIDLILMASRNYSFFERLVRSSVSKKLLNIADVPVVLLKNKPVG
ncbi:MAG TPA: universal stress protein [Parapedobacter sp.]|nr:universal stress protein [Parapedobacter sp.]